MDLILEKDRDKPEKDKQLTKHVLKILHTQHTKSQQVKQ
jgi:hypothetical protein